MAPTSNKRKAAQAIDLISFDPDARAEWLSGFRKRKQARIRHAQEQAAAKDRSARIEERKHIREQRQKDLETHVRKVEEMLAESRRARQDAGDDMDAFEQGSEDDSQSSESNDGGHEDEYEDTEKFTTVTVAPMNVTGSDSDDSRDDLGVENRNTATPSRTARSTSARVKRKKKKFRYEGKEQRKLDRFKQKSANHKAARLRKVN